MKIGIIVFSQTGNTVSIGEKIYQKLLKLKYDTEFEQIKLVDNSLPRKEPFKLNVIPSTDKYDIIILGSFVEAFQLSPVMKSYIDQINNLNNKKIICFVTQFFPYEWMGGKNSVNQMKKLCNNKNGNVIKTAVINWKNKNRINKSNKLIEEICSIV